MSLTAVRGRDWSVDHRDFAEVVELDQTYLHAPWTRSGWEVLADSMLLYVWHAPGPVGFALYQLSPEEHLAHLLKIVMAPSARGAGTEAFWRAQRADLTVQNCKRIYLEVAANNAAAIRFYEKSGFRMLRRVRSFYSDGSDALSMELSF